VVTLVTELSLSSQRLVTKMFGCMLAVLPGVAGSVSTAAADGSAELSQWLSQSVPVRGTPSHPLNAVSVASV